MDITFATDKFNRLICTVDADGHPAVLTSSDRAEAAASLLAALDDVEETGFGECFWPEGAGEYRWMFRKRGAQVSIVTMWSTGTITGWEQIVRADTDLELFAARVRFELTNIAAATAAEH